MLISKETNPIMSTSTEDIKDWNQIASRYREFADPDNFIQRQFTAALWDSLGDVRGLQILDLGCGPGWLSQQLHEAGAKVLGIDGSAELIKAAQASFPDVEFLEYDLSLGLPPVGRSFDRVIANMVLMDIPDITLLIQSMHEVLCPRGKFIFTMQHPCFFHRKSHRDEDGQLYKKVTGYLKPETWRIEGFGGHNHYHRSLTYYFDHLRANRLAVTRLYEPEHILQTEKPAEDLAYYRSIPIFIFIEATPL